MQTALADPALSDRKLAEMFASWAPVDMLAAPISRNTIAETRSAVAALLRELQRENLSKQAAACAELHGGSVHLTMLHVHGLAGQWWLAGWWADWLASLP